MDLKFLKQMVDLVKKEKNDEIKYLLDGVSEKQKYDLINDAIKGAIDNFAQILEAVLDNTSLSTRYQIMIHSLKVINTADIAETHLLSIWPILYLKLNNVALSTLTFLAEFLLSQIRDGTGKNRLWTELLPRIMQIIVVNGCKDFVTPDDLTLSGYSYRTKFVNMLINSSDSWKRNVIPDIASMLKQGIPLSGAERFLVFDKLCNSVEKLDPSSLSTFALHLFHASFEPKLFVGVLLALDKYFRYYYWKKINSSEEPEPTQMSVMEEFPDIRFRREEDVIISQIFYIMEYKFAELSLSNALQEITLIPELLLTPFMFESLIAMTRINQTSDAGKVTVSTLLTKTIHTAIQNNYTQILIFKSSFYIQSVLEDFPKAFNIEKVIDQIRSDSQTGIEVITPGLFGLAYSLLKNKKENQQLHQLSAFLLANLLHRRPLYTRGVFEKLISMMMSATSNSQQNIYRECLEKLVTSKDIILEPTDYQDTLIKAFEDIPFMTSGVAVNVMTIVLPLLRRSGGTNLRNLFVNMLRRATPSQNIRNMAVYGCGLLLKQIKYKEITAQVKPHDLTAAYMTGYPLRNQMTQMNTDKLSPHDMMTLEIMGILTKTLCFDYDVKHIMYRGLRKAADANNEVLPHIIDFLIPQLQQYIDNIGSNIALKLDSIIKVNSEVVVINDDIGTLTELLVHCVVEADSRGVTIENVFLRDFLTKALDKVLFINQLDNNPPFTQSKYILATQFLSFLESLMTFAIWKATDSNGFIMKLLKLSDHYHHCYDELKKLANPKTGNKRKKETCPQNLQTLKSVWDLGTLLRFLGIYFDVDNKGLTEDLVTRLKLNSQLKTKVLKATIDYFDNIRSEPAYIQIKFSTKRFEELCDCAKISFERLFYSNEELCCDEMLMVFEIFKECIITATTVFTHKFEKLINKLPNDGDDDFETNVCRIIAQLTEMITKLCESTEESEFLENSYETKLLAINVSVVEMFLPYINPRLPFCAKTYEIFFQLTTQFTMNAKSLGMVLKALFTLRQKAKPLGDFYITTAALFAKEYDYINSDAIPTTENFQLRAITKHTLESATIHYFVALKSHLEQNAFLLKKANSLIYRFMKIPGQKKFSDQILSQVKEIEKMTINLLTVICKAMLVMSNAKIPLGKVADNFFRVLIHMYSNGEKLIKIFINHNVAVEEDIDFYGLKDLCIASRHLTRPVATFVQYTEKISTLAASNGKLTGLQAAKMVLRDERFIPKYTYSFEKFTYEIHRLSTKTTEKFNLYLHLGVYRDFRIKPEDLKNSMHKEHVPNIIEGQNGSDVFETIEDDTDSSSDESNDCEPEAQNQPEENSKRVRKANEFTC